MGRIAQALKKAEKERIFRSGSPSRFTRAAAQGDEPGTGVGTDLGEHPTAFSRGRLRSAPAPAEPGVERLTPLPAWEVHPAVVAIHGRTLPITEQYRAARTWLLRRNADGKGSCLAVTSSIPREGKSVTTANLAAAMAEVRHMNVLVADCDLRQATLARLFKLPNSPGLADVLGGRCLLDEAIKPTPLGNLWFLPAGDCLDLGPTELLNSKAAARVFDEIRERYHFTLVDTPPVGRLSDVGVIGALCTGIVMVVRMNKTASHIVRQSVHWLQANHLDVIGCIAADCSTRGTRYEYEDHKGD